eukprot:4921175-Amphidinium_carterae.1
MLVEAGQLICNVGIAGVVRCEMPIIRVTHRRALLHQLLMPPLASSPYRAYACPRSSKAQPHALT